MIISPPSAVYRQTLANRVAVCVLMTFPVVILAIIGLAGDEPQLVPLTIMALILGATIWMCIAIGRTQISIHAEGIRRTSFSGAKEIEWKDVAEYRYRLVPIQTVGGLIGVAIMAAAARRGSRGMNMFFKLIANDGRKIQVSSNFKNAEEAIGRILGQIHPAMQKKVNAQLDQGAAKFGDVTLSRLTIQWKNKPPVVLSEVTKAEIKGTKLSIRKKDKVFDAISAPAQNIPNVLLLLETLDTLGLAKNQAPSIDPLARVR
jgi:hypothetical protein